MQHTEIMIWPNGRGETHVTAEYAAAVDRARDLNEQHRDDPSAENYQLWQQAEAAVVGLQAAGGHVGKRVFYF